MCVERATFFFNSLLSDHSDVIQLNLSLELNCSATTVTTPFQWLERAVLWLNLSRLCSDSGEACILSLRVSFFFVCVCVCVSYEGSVLRDCCHFVHVARETVTGTPLSLRSVCSLETRFAVVVSEERSRDCNRKLCRRGGSRRCGFFHLVLQILRLERVSFWLEKKKSGWDLFFSWNEQWCLMCACSLPTQSIFLLFSSKLLWRDIVGGFLASIEGRRLPFEVQLP